MTTDPIFHRLQILVGPKVLEQMKNTNVIVFGVGGVGSWCAEGLVRNGVGHLTIVDSDVVCVTNVNRQLVATTANVGKSKVEELKKRLLEINPQAKIQAVQETYNTSTFEKFDLASRDYVIDAIDSLSSKVDLIARTLEAGDGKDKPLLFSAMGASCKLDPTRIQIESFWKTRGCPLAKFVRKRLRNRGATQDFKCVFSNELLPAFPSPMDNDTQKQINGSAVHVTSIFGFYLAGMVLQDVVDKVSDTVPRPAQKQS